MCSKIFQTKPQSSIPVKVIVTSCFFQGGLQAVAKNYTLVKLVAKKIQTSQTSCQEDTE